MSSAVDELFDLLEQAGAKVTLYGKPATREDVKRVALERHLGTRPWGVYDVEQKLWWPRCFRTREEAQAHYDRCKGPGSRGEPRLIAERVAEEVGK